MTTQGPSVEPAKGTCACIAHHAATRPDALAIMHRGVGLTWRTLATNLLSVIEELDQLGMRLGQTLGFEVDDRYLHLLIILAGEALGLTTVSLSVADIGPPADLGRLCHRIVASRPPPGHAGKAWIVAPDWPVRVLTRTWDDLPLGRLCTSPSPGAVLRLMMTSGTTGRPKVMGMSQALLVGHIRVLSRMTAEPAASRPMFLCLYRFTVRAVHTRTMLTLRLGGTVHFTGIDALWDLLRAGAGNYLVMLSGDLERLARTAPPGVIARDVHIDVIGGHVTDGLRAEARARISPHIAVSYATNETHVVALMQEGGMGRVLPDARVRIVSDDGRPVPPGGTGLIQVRTSTMVDGYVDAPDADRAAFADGWYRTSDVGYQPDPATLVVLGRADDMLNIGGMKLAPAPIEVRLKALAGVRDALVTEVGDRLETRAMLVAVELAAGADRPHLARQIDAVISHYTRGFHLLMLDALPRTETGKIKRDAVRALYRQRVG